MADQERLLLALRNAHAAGDTAAASRFAQMIREGQGAEQEPAGLASLIPSSLNRGSAMLLDSVVDAPNKLANMGRAAIGAGLYATGNTGAQDFADRYGFTTMVDDPSPFDRLLDAMGAGQVRPVTPLEKRVDWMAKAVPATMLSPVQGAASIAKIAGMNALSGLAGGETYERTGNTNAALLASILAPMAVNAVPAVASAAKNMRQPFTQNGPELAAGDFLRNNSANAPEAIAKLEATRKPTVQGSKPTTGQILAEAGDNRVLGYEKQLAEDVAHRQPFDERYAANKAARDAQMRRMAPGEEGAALVQQRVREEVAQRQAIAEGQTQNAAASRDWAMGQAGREMPTLQAGQNMANVYDDLNNQYRQQARDNYDIDPENTIKDLPVPARQIGQVFEEVYAGASESAPPSIRKSMRIVGQIAKPQNPAIDGDAQPRLTFADDMRPANQTDFQMSYNQMKVAAGRIGELERTASKAGEGQSAMALGRIKKALRQSMDDAVEQGRITPEIADAYRKATAEYAIYDLNMKKNVAGQLQFRNGERGIKLENVPRSFLQSGEEAFRSFQRSIGGDDTATATAQDWLSTQWRNSVRSPEGKIKPNWKASSAKWLTDNAEVLDTYPGLKQRVEYAIAKAGTAEGLAKRLDAEMQRLGSGTGAKHFLRDMNPQTAFERFVKSPNRIEESKLIGAIAKRDPEFKAGLSTAMREHVQGMTDPQLIKFLDNAGNQKLINDLFGDRMLSQWKKIAQDARRDQLRRVVTKTDGSPTESNKAARRVLASIVGRVPVLGIVQSVAGDVASRMTAKTTALKQRAFLDPQVAAGLMKQSAATPDALTQAQTNLGKTLLDFPDIEKRALIIHNLQTQERKRK